MAVVMATQVLFASAGPLSPRTASPNSPSPTSLARRAVPSAGPARSSYWASVSSQNSRYISSSLARSHWHLSETTRTDTLTFSNSASKPTKTTTEVDTVYYDMPDGKYLTTMAQTFSEAVAYYLPDDGPGTRSTITNMVSSGTTHAPIGKTVDGKAGATSRNCHMLQDAPAFVKPCEELGDRYKTLMTTTFQ
ncbi:MAG: hypothetical protein M1820_004790 [Bogoriella megaspora]|nr:MAG: hypothetical protein M1820_004790 [Bogoriella megaspora]